MEIVVHDNTLKTVAVINNNIPMLPSFFNDNWHRYKDQGAETFIFTVNKFINGQLQDYCRFLNEQAYISFTYDGIDHLFGVDNVQESDYQITLTCSSLNLELRNEQANALVNTSSHNIQWYFDQMELISNAQITIGTNEVSSLTRTINYDGQESKLARLISVIGNFNAEFEFITHLNDDGTLDSIILNIYRANDGVNIQGVGTNRNDVSLNFGKNISGITRTGDTTNLFNATKITGSDNLNWNSSEFSYVNSDGVEEFYKRKNDDTAFAPLSLNLFKSQIKSNNGDKWIRKDFQTEYTNVNDMWGYCVSQFKQFAYPTVTYEVLANSSLVLESVGNDRPLSIGDTINIQDDNFMDSDGNVGLLLSARVSEMEISFSNPTLNKITFSNFKKQQSEASTDIQAIVNQLVDAATPYIGSIDTTNGTQFKNGTGSTTLSAHIFKGSATTETIADSYEWSKDGKVVANAQTIIVDASGVSDKAVYSFKATVGGKVVASQSVTITNVDDGKQGLKGDPGSNGIPGQPGADGRTSYLHIAYATNSTGTAGFDVSDASDKTYIGQYTDFTSADSTDPSKYTWSLIKGDKGDTGERGLQGEKGEQGIPGSKGADGKTQYTHIAYANSADGNRDFSTSDSNRTYIGMYVDFNVNDSTTPSDYSWTLVKGADGTQGTPGKPGADGKTPYFHTAWSYSADGKDRFTTVYPNLNLLNFNSGVTFGKHYGWPADVTNSSPYRAYFKKVKVTPNTQYTISADWSKTAWLSVYAFTNESDTTAVSRFGSGDRLGAGFWDSNFVGGFTITSNKTLTIPANVNYIVVSYASVSTDTLTLQALLNGKPKLEQGLVATPWMPSSSEVTTADWPSYIGQYTDFTQTDSTNPSAYTWSLIRGNDGKDGKDGIAGKDGVGIKTTVITYAISTSGTIAPTTGWTSSVPSLIKGQYLWTKTVWTYTDNSSETGYSVTYISKDGNNGNDGIAGKDGVGILTTTITYAGSTSGTTAPTIGWTATVPTVEAGSYLWTKTVWAYTDNTSETGYSVAKMGSNGAIGPQGPQGNTGATGPQGPTGPAGSNGNPGKVVSDTEPTDRFKGLTWKYSGTADLTASEGTVIHPNTEYYYNGTNWMINYLSANNFEANSITADLIDAKNLTITDGEFVSTIIDGSVQIQTEIKDDYLMIYKMDTSHNEIHTIALKSDSGLVMTYQNSDTGEYTSAGVNFQSLFMQNNITNEFARLTPQGTKLSTDVPWIKLSLMNNFTGNIEYAIINGTVYISASGVGVPAMTAGQWKQAAQLPTGSSAIPIRANRITAGDSGDGLSWALLSNQAGGLFIRCSANKAATANLFNATLPYPIG